jgi:aryl-alcohol dehydrogenase-like predicted oxidoreductase
VSNTDRKKSVTNRERLVGGIGSGYSSGNVRADVEQSLRRLRTGHLDLVQVHMSPSKATFEENHIAETLMDLQVEGKVRFIGMSGMSSNLPGHIAMGLILPGST